MNLPSALRGGRMVHGAHFRRQRYLRGVFALSRRREIQRPDGQITLKKPVPA